MITPEDIRKKRKTIAELKEANRRTEERILQEYYKERLEYYRRIYKEPEEQQFVDDCIQNKGYFFLNLKNKNADMKKVAVEIKAVVKALKEIYGINWKIVYVEEVTYKELDSHLQGLARKVCFYPRTNFGSFLQKMMRKWRKKKVANE